MKEKINIYTCYNPEADTLTIKLPGTDLIADRKSGTLRIVEEKSEGKFTEYVRNLRNIMFADMVDFIGNKTKEYSK